MLLLFGFVGSSSYSFLESFGGSVSDLFGMGECLSNRGSVGISFASRSRDLDAYRPLCAK